MKNFFIGIDVSKKTLDVAFFFRENSGEKRYAKFENSKKGFNELLKWTREQMKPFGTKLCQEQCQFCCENTGVYSIDLCEHLYKRHLDICHAHALEVKRSMGVQRSKTDKADAAVIAEYAMRFEDKLHMFRPQSDRQKALQELLSFRAEMVKERAGLKARKSEKDCTSERSKAKAFIKRHTQSVIDALSRQIAATEEQILGIIAEDKELRDAYEILTSMPGIGLINAVTMLVYTDSFNRFEYDARKLCCYYGIAPFAHESGTSVHRHPGVSPYADKGLKAVLSQAALSAIRFNPLMAEYYSRCLARGKHPLVALNNVKNKMLHILVSMLRHRRPFDAGFEVKRQLFAPAV